MRPKSGRFGRSDLSEMLVEVHDRHTVRAFTRVVERVPVDHVFERCVGRAGPAASVWRPSAPRASAALRWRAGSPEHPGR